MTAFDFNLFSSSSQTIEQINANLYTDDHRCCQNFSCFLTFTRAAVMMAPELIMGLCGLSVENNKILLNNIKQTSAHSQLHVIHIYAICWKYIKEYFICSFDV